MPPNECVGVYFDLLYVKKDRFMKRKLFVCITFEGFQRAAVKRNASIPVSVLATAGLRSTITTFLSPLEMLFHFAVTFTGSLGADGNPRGGSAPLGLWQRP